MEVRLRSFGFNLLLAACAIVCAAGSAMVPWLIGWTVPPTADTDGTVYKWRGICWAYSERLIHYDVWQFFDVEVISHQLKSVPVSVMVDAYPNLTVDEAVERYHRDHASPGVWRYGGEKQITRWLDSHHLASASASIRRSVQSDNGFATHAYMAGFGWPFRMWFTYVPVDPPAVLSVGDVLSSVPRAEVGDRLRMVDKSILIPERFVFTCISWIAILKLIHVGVAHGPRWIRLLAKRTRDLPPRTS